MMLRRRTSHVVLSFFSLCVGVSPSYAQTRAICPGGASPRSDVFACYEFDNLANCTTGQEATCLTDNGLNATEFNTFFNQARITNEGGAAEGNGFIQLRMVHPGASGPSIQRNTQFSSTNVRQGFYVRFKNWISYTQGPHSIGMFPGSGGTCIIGGTMELRQDKLFGYVTKTGVACATVSFPDLNQNVTSTPALRNDRWYWVETEQIIDTSCSNSTVWDGCNGVFRMWVDGTLILEYTNLNYEGVTNAATFTGFFIARMYFHPGVPGFDVGKEPRLEFDGIVVARSSSAISTIGPDPGENARGTADANSPYVGHTFRETFSVASGNTQKPANDCTLAGGQNGISRAGTLGTLAYRSFPSTPARNGWDNLCSEQGYGENTNGSLQIDIPSGSGAVQSGGYFFPPNGDSGFDTILSKSIATSIYVPCSTTYVDVALMGHRANKTSVAGTLCGQVLGSSALGDNTFYNGIGVSSTGKWARIERRGNNNIVPTVVASTRDATCDTWHDVELIEWPDHTYTFRTRTGGNPFTAVWDRQAWAIPSVVGATEWNFGWVVNPFVGAMEHCGDQSFTVNFDDLWVAEPAYRSCDGWTSGFCPQSFNVAAAPSQCTATPRGRRGSR